MKKILMFLMVVTLLVSLVGCGGNDSNKEIEDSESTYTEEKSDNESNEKFIYNESNDYNTVEYYSCLTEDGEGLMFDVTIEEFLREYNKLKSSYENKDYKDIELSDFFYIEDGSSINGSLGEAYGCSQTIIGNFDDLVISLNKEKNGDRIFGISFGIKNNKYIDMYYSDDMFPSMMNQYRLLICAITGCDMSKAIQYTDEMFSNNTLSTYDKGVLFTADTSNSLADWYRIVPCTEEQYQTVLKN